MLLASLLQDFEPVRPGFVEVKISDDQFRSMLCEAGQSGDAVGVREDLVSLMPQQFGHHLHHGKIVINQKDFGHRWARVEEQWLSRQDGIERGKLQTPSSKIKRSSKSQSFQHSETCAGDKFAQQSMYALANAR